ncbi:MAG: SLBB domain-containing protein [Myxococcota bacterium]
MVRPGDELIVALPQHDPREQTVQVDLRGNIFIEPYGNVDIGGRDLDSAERHLRRKLRRYVVHTAGITLILKARKRLVLVSGMVAEPGLVRVEEKAGIWAAIKAAGGPAEGADLGRVLLARDGREEVVDVRRWLTAPEDREELPELKAADVLFVPAGPGQRIGGGRGDEGTIRNVFLTEDTMKGQVFVLGAVGSPGLYPRSSSLNPLTALGLAGGPTADADLTAARLITPLSSQSVNLLAALRSPSSELPPLPEEGGAILYVPDREAKMGPSINVVGAVRTPGRIPVAGAISVPDAVALAGGPEAEADLDDVRLVKVGSGFTLAAEYRMDDWYRDGGVIALAEVEPGDSLLVEWRPRVWRDVFRVVSDLALISTSIAVLFIR